MKWNRPAIFWIALWCLTVVGLTWWSYALVDPNLTLLRWDPFVQWQTGRWQELLNPALLAQQYYLIVVAWWMAFLGVMGMIWRQPTKAKEWVIPLLVVTVLILFAGHNAHSRDIYNYLFNAKMVTQYQADPHVQTALDFPDDPWIRFMHNVHTPAPYAYGWTWLSLVPFVLSGAGKSFLLTYLAMRAWMVLGWGVFLGAVWWALGKSDALRTRRWERWSLLAFHPLVLMEVLLNGHNDVWMMAPAAAAYGFLLWKPRRFWQWGAIAGLLGLSVAVKFVTIVLVPIFVGHLILELAPKILSRKWTLLAWIERLAHQWSADLAALALVVPLFTARSQQFHPWYAVWFLAWLPFVRSAWLRWSLLGLSLTSQLRYLPWIQAGFQYNPEVQWQMRVITWSGLILGCTAYGLWRISQKRR